MERKIPAVLECEYILLKAIWENDGSIKMKELIKSQSSRWKSTTVHKIIKRLSSREIVKLKDGVVTALYTRAEMQQNKFNNFNEDIVVTVPKVKMTKKSADMLTALGYKVVLLDISKPQKDTGYNPYIAELE